MLEVAPSWCKQPIHPDSGFSTPRFYRSMMTLYRSETAALTTSILEVSTIIFKIFLRCMLGIGTLCPCLFYWQFCYENGTSTNQWQLLLVLFDLMASDRWWFFSPLVFQGLFHDCLQARTCLNLFWTWWHQECYVYSDVTQRSTLHFYFCNLSASW